MRVFAPTGFNGHSATITVTATNANNETSQRTFTAAAVADTATQPPFLGAVNNQTTTQGTAVTFTLTSTNLSGAAYYLQGGRRDDVWHAGQCHDQHQPGDGAGDGDAGGRIHGHDQLVGRSAGLFGCRLASELRYSGADGHGQCHDRRAGDADRFGRR